MLEDTVLARPTLRGRHLSRTFGEGETLATALDDVSLDLYPGQIVLLMGPSGSGKSTLLAVLSGLLHPTSGQVLALGEDLWKMSERQRERFRLRHVGFIFQGYNLFPALSARQQLEMVLRWGEGVSGRQARKRSDEMLSLLGLAKKAQAVSPVRSSRFCHRGSAWALISLARIALRLVAQPIGVNHGSNSHARTISPTATGFRR